MIDYDEFAEEEWVDDEDDDGEDDVLECPSCRGSVHEDTQQCPHCGDWITPVWPGEQRRRAIWAVAAVLVIISLLLFVVF